MPIIEPKEVSTEPELIIPTPSGVDCIALSGYARFSVLDSTTQNGPSHSDLIGDSDEDGQWVPYEVRMVVGRKWRAVRNVSPIVTVAGFRFDDSDEADDSGCTVDTCTWDTIGLTEDQTEFELIRLKIDMRVRGGAGFSVTKLAYHLVAVGLLG